MGDTVLGAEGRLWSDDLARNTLWSPGFTHYLRLQPDGSLVIRSTSDSTVVWSTSAGPPADRYFLIMQTDGNLRVYTATSTGTDGMAVVWSSGASHTCVGTPSLHDAQALFHLCPL
jgi:hypothetical protein